MAERDLATEQLEALKIMHAQQLGERDSQIARLREQLETERAAHQERLRELEAERVERDARESARSASSWDRLKQIKLEKQHSCEYATAKINELHSSMCGLIADMPEMVGTVMQTRGPGAQRLYDIVKSAWREPTKRPRCSTAERALLQLWSELESVERAGGDVNRQMLQDVERFIVPAGDPRMLGGQAGIRARRRIPLGTAYPVSSCVATKQDYHLAHAELGDLADAERYSFSLETKFTGPARAEFVAMGEELIADLRSRDGNM